MTSKRPKDKKKAQNKNKHILRRMQQCTSRNINNPDCACEETVPAPSTKTNQPAMTSKDVANALLNVSLKALYNDGDKVELRLVEDILTPNQIQFEDDKSHESFWDILTHSGLINPSIGFGNNGKVSISKAGFDIMTHYGSYANYLNAQSKLPVTPITKDEDSEI